MRIHVVMHVPFEGPGLIAEWAHDRGHALSSALALTEEFPPVEEIQMLVVMGGPMDADDETASPWLRAEKHYVAEAVAAGRLVLGVCLGAQIIAEVLGGRVKRNRHREIGWFPVQRTADADEEPLFAEWPESMVVGHWHGDTFDLPLGMEPVLSSEACANQAFVFDRRVVGLQFHAEWTAEIVEELVARCGTDCEDTGMWVMSHTEILDETPERVVANEGVLFALLDAMAAEGAGMAGELA